MTDTIRTRSYLATALADNSSGDITPQLIRDWLISLTLGLIPTAVKTANYTAAEMDLIPVNATSGSLTVTLPAAPADKTIVGVKLVVTASAHTATVACGGSDVFNVAAGATSLTLALLNQGLVVQYNSASAIWYVVCDDLSLSQLDARYDAAGAAATAQSTAEAYAATQASAAQSAAEAAAVVQAVTAANGLTLTGGTLAFSNSGKSWNGNTITIAEGGTGQTTASAAFNALSPLTTAGDALYGGASGAGTRLAIGTAGQALVVNGGATAPQWGTLGIGGGGTGQTTASAAFNALSPLTTAGDALYGGSAGAGTRLAIGTAGQALVVNGGATAPQWGTLGIGGGGTGQTTASAAFNALSPLTTLGDVLYGGASGAGTRLAGNTTTIRKFVSQTGTGSASAAPVLTALAASDIPGTLGPTTLTGSLTLPSNQYVFFGSSLSSIYGDSSGNLVLSNGSSGTIQLAGPAITGQLSSAWVTLTYASTTATNAALGNNFEFTATGNFTLGNPTNAVDGQIIRWRIIQDGTGSRILTLGSNFELGTDIASVVLSTAANAVDYVAAVYRSSSGKFDVVSVVRGY